MAACADTQLIANSFYSKPIPASSTAPEESGEECVGRVGLSQCVSDLTVNKLHLYYGNDRPHVLRFSFPTPLYTLQTANHDSSLSYVISMKSTQLSNQAT